MARKVSILLLTIMFVLLVGPMSVWAGQSDKVKDDLNLLKEEELKEVQSLIDRTVNEYNLDVVIVTTDDTKGKTSRDFADDYYDYNGFGTGNDKSGLLMLINMKEGEVWISTTGKAIDIFTDARISDMVGTVTGFLSKGGYYDGCKEFVNKVRFYADKGIPSRQHRIDTEASGTYLKRVVRQMKSVPVYIAGVIISLLATIIASLSNKGKVTINNQTYEEEGSFKLTGTYDDYIRETTTKVKVESNSNSGSSTHRGSSGTTHGGGGGKF